MRILTIGCGHIGAVIARDLTETLPSAEVTISDRQLEIAKRTAATIGKGKVHYIKLNVSAFQDLIAMLKSFDIVVGLTPGRLGYQAVKASIRARVDIVDLSYMPQNPLMLNEEALRSRVTVIPDCGVAPGLSNILIGRAVAMLDKVKEVRILVGGIPERPIPPLGYKVTWSAEDLVEEYVREVKIVQEGKTIGVSALEGLEIVEHPQIGRLEAFYTDGVRTLHETLKGVENMWEKTMRYPGHAEKIKLLIELGLFDEDPVKLRGVRVAPRELTTVLLERRLNMPEVRDLVAMNVEVIGTRGNSEIVHTFKLLDRFDEKRQVTAMARTTAYTASTIIQLLSKNVIRDEGVIPPEKLGMNNEVYREIIAELEKRKIKVDHQYIRRK